MADEQRREKVVIKPVEVQQRIQCRVACLDAKVDSRVTDREAKVNQERILFRLLCKCDSKIACQHGRAGSALCPDESVQTAISILYWKVKYRLAACWAVN